MRAANLALKFLLELCALASFGYAGTCLFGGAARIVAAIALPLIGALVWGRWAAPRSTRRLALPARLPLELAVLLLGALALAGGGHLMLGLTFAVLIVANAALLTRFGQWEH